jgi:predicted ATPase/DNA-binding SARP family transcriptional activator
MRKVNCVFAKGLLLSIAFLQCGDGTEMLEVRLFGKFEVRLDGRPIEIPSRPAQSLLAYLMLNADRSHRREKLAGLLWPDSEEVNARNNLRQTLWRLRKAVGEDYFLADRVSVGFNPNANYRLDVAILQEGVAEKDSADALIRSVSVYEDILLPGFYDDWVVLEQGRLQAIFEDRMQMLLDRLVEEARWREVREWAERWIAQGQVPEPAYRALMMAHAGLGDQATVATVFQRCAEALDKEIGVESSTETRELFQRLTAGRGLPRAQAGGTESGPTVNLPLQPTPFIGRENELARLAALLADPTIRLVTILGPGGIGKTLLAIEAAKTQSEAFADGVCFVSLASLDDPNLIVSPIAEAISFPFYVRDQTEHWEFDPQKEQLLAYLREKQMLLVLDNLEHLLPPPLSPASGGEGGGAGLIADILRVAPKVEILTTSRERLNLHGETLFALDGMSYPKREAIEARGTPSAEESQDMAAYSAVQLFVQSARRVQPGFELTSDNLVDVVDICQLVDGMPLGIELAAAWVELLSPAEIAAEIRNSLDFLATDLRDVPDRQRSIRSVFEASWHRVTKTEQDVFQQLSVFRGGFAREAAQNATGASLRTLMALVHKSLLRPDLEGRYQIHELLRQFGAERLAKLPAEEAAARDRHCTYFATFLKHKEADLVVQNQGMALAEIETELGNVRAAWDWAVAQGKLEEIDQSMESLCEFYRIRGGLDEGFETFNPAVLALGWEGLRTPEDLPAGHEMFNETMHMLGLDTFSPESGAGKREILGKVLARYSRFY